MINWLSKILENSSKFSVKEQKLKLIKNTYRLTALFCLILTFVGYLIDYELSLIMMPVGFVLFYSLSMLVKPDTNINFLGNLFIFFASIILISMITFSGGIYSPVIAWVSAGPTFALLLLDRKTASIWTFIMIMVLITFLILEVFSITPEAQYNQAVKPYYFLSIFISLLVMITIVNLIFENSTEAALKKVEDKNEIISEKNKNITDSIRYAENIQKAILPSTRKLNKFLPSNSILFIPKDIVSGDFYWFARTNDISFIAAVDCTGHGVPGAFMSMIGNQILNKLVYEKNILEVDELLSALHHDLKKALRKEDTEINDGMDLALLSIHQNSNEVHFAGAMNPVIIKSNNELKTIKGDRLSIGGDNSDKTFTKHIFKAEKGDQFFIFSDGLQDQFGGPNNKKFKIKRVKEIILEERNLASLSSRLQNEVLNWMGEEEQTDDILFVGVEV